METRPLSVTEAGSLLLWTQYSAYLEVVVVAVVVVVVVVAFVLRVVQAD